MPVAINMPGRPQAKEKESDFDKVMKGLSIANSVLGIFSGVKKIGTDARDQERLDAAEFADAERLDLQQQQFQAQQDAAAGAEFDKAEQFDYQKQKDEQAAKYQKEKDERDYGLKERTLALQERSARQNAALFPPNSADARMQKLGAQEKQRLDNVRLGFQSIGDMQSALGAGENTFSLIGDNRFTVARRTFEEALGRMQSGGAISKDEELRFQKMAPTVWDSKEIQAQKLAQLQQEMGARFQTLGFKPEDFGLAYNTQQISEDQIRSNAGGGISALPNANAAALRPPQQKSMPQKVIQNGHEYILNPKTGKYE